MGGGLMTFALKYTYGGQATYSVLEPRARRLVRIVLIEFQEQGRDE